MKKHAFWILIAVVIAAFLAGSCSGSSSGASILEAGLYKDPSGSQPTEQYGWLDVFYCLVEVSGATPETVLKASWVAADTNRLRPNYLLKMDEKTVSSSPVLFELKNEGNFWPEGTFQLYLYLDGKEERVIEFEVIPGEIP